MLKRIISRAILFLISINEVTNISHNKKTKTKSWTWDFIRLYIVYRYFDLGGWMCVRVTGLNRRREQRVQTQLKAPTNPSFLAFAFSSRSFLVNWTVIFVVTVTWNLIRGCMLSGLVMKFFLCKIPLLYCCVPLAGTEALTSW